MHDPELTPEQDEQVRRLLAEARLDAPVPADVAERLDAVLSDLSRDQPVAPVVDLAARRRRRNAAALLLGAAAVIVGGFGIGQVIDVGDGADDAGGDTAAVADRDVASEDAAGGSAEQGELDSGDASRSVQDVAPLQLRSQSLAADLDAQLPERLAAAEAQPNAPADGGQTFQHSDCSPAPLAAYGRGVLYPAYYDGIPAVVALRPPAGGQQQADVLECSTATALASVTIPRP